MPEDRKLLQNRICRRRDSNPHGHSPVVFKTDKALAELCRRVPAIGYLQVLF